MIALGGYGFLLALSWTSWVVRRWFAGAAVVGATAVALVLHHGFLDLSDQAGWARSQEGIWYLFAFQFFPILLLAWKHSWKTIVVFVSATGALDYAIGWLLRDGFGLWSVSYLHGLLWRSAALAVAGIGISLLLRHLKRANLALKHQALTIAQLSESRERNRIARELHDTLAHSLSALAIQLEACQAMWSRNPERTKELLGDALGTTRHGLAESRRAIGNLRATPLEMLGLGNALRECAENASARAGLEVAVAIPESLPDGSDAVSQCVYRIAQEALENALRHSQARKISLGVSRLPDGLQLDVADDGVGFEPTERLAGTRFGLEGMRERAELIGARLVVQSAVGKGCQVSLTWRDGN
ncbi:MAG: hypothetical protein RL318_913 [Fibrobacterota bacterium]